MLFIVSSKGTKFTIMSYAYKFSGCEPNILEIYRHKKTEIRYNLTDQNHFVFMFALTLEQTLKRKLAQNLN